MLQMGNFMEFFCRHCDKVVNGSMYRVLSEEEGRVMLNMVVCRHCYDQARQLGLDGEEIQLNQNSRERLPMVHSVIEAAHQ